MAPRSAASGAAAPRAPGRPGASPSALVSRARAAAGTLRGARARHPRRQGRWRADAPVRPRSRGRRRPTVSYAERAAAARAFASTLPKFDPATPRWRATCSDRCSISVEKRSPTLKDAMVEARAGRYGAAALEALGAGDQTAAAFLRGVDFYAKGQLDQAARSWRSPPARAASSSRRRSSSAPPTPRPAATATPPACGRCRWAPSRGRPSFYAMVADARLRDGIPDAAIDILKPAYAGAAGQRRDRAASRHGLRDDLALRRGDAGARRVPGAASHRPGAAAGGDREPVRAGAGRAGGCRWPTWPRCGATPAPTRGPRGRWSGSTWSRCRRSERSPIHARVQLPVVHRRARRLLRARLRRQRLGVAPRRLDAASRGRARLRRDGGPRASASSAGSCSATAAPASSTTIAICRPGSTRTSSPDLDAALEIAAAHGIVLDLVLLDHPWMFSGVRATLPDPATGGALEARLPRGRAHVLHSEAGRRALFAHVLEPLVRRYGAGGERADLVRRRSAPTSS